MYATIVTYIGQLIGGTGGLARRRRYNWDTEPNSYTAASHPENSSGPTSITKGLLPPSERKVK
jgi:hypothetical protein